MKNKKVVSGHLKVSYSFVKKFFYKTGVNVTENDRHHQFVGQMLKIHSA